MRSSSRANRSRIAPAAAVLAGGHADQVLDGVHVHGRGAEPGQREARDRVVGPTSPARPAGRGRGHRARASPSSIDRIVAPIRRASATCSSRRSGAASGATTNSVSPRPTVVEPVETRPAGAGARRSGGAHRTKVGESSARPENRASSSRWAARCHGSSCGVPTSRRPPAGEARLCSTSARSRGCARPSPSSRAARAAPAPWRRPSGHRARFARPADRIDT